MKVNELQGQQEYKRRYGFNAEVSKYHCKHSLVNKIGKTTNRLTKISVFDNLSDDWNKTCHNTAVSCSTCQGTFI